MMTSITDHGLPFRKKLLCNREITKRSSSRRRMTSDLQYFMVTGCVNKLSHGFLTTGLHHLLFCFVHFWEVAATKGSSGSQTVHRSPKQYIGHWSLCSQAQEAIIPRKSIVGGSLPSCNMRGSAAVVALWMQNRRSLLRPRFESRLQRASTSLLSLESGSSMTVQNFCLVAKYSAFGHASGSGVETAKLRILFLCTLWPLGQQLSSSRKEAYTYTLL